MVGVCKGQNVLSCAAVQWPYDDLDASGGEGLQLSESQSVAECIVAD